MEPGSALSLLQTANQLGWGVLVSAAVPPEASRSFVFANEEASVLLGSPVAQSDAGTEGWTRLGRARFVASEETAISHVRDSGVIEAAPSPRTAVAERRGILRREDGSEVTVRWVRVAVSPPTPAWEVHLLIPAQPRRDTELRLSESDNLFQRILDACPTAILTVVGSHVVYANHAMAKVYGCHHPPPLWTDALSELVAPEDWPGLSERMESLQAAPSAPLSLTVRGRTESGSFFPLELLLVPTHLEEQRAVLVIARERLKDAQGAGPLPRHDGPSELGTLTAGVAHEINNPLAYVLLNLQYLEKELPRIGSFSARMGQLLDRLADARRGSERVASIVRDLHTFSQHTENETLLVDVTEVVRNCIKAARLQGPPGLRFVEELPPLPPVRGEAGRLEQVFTNLIFNAVQALPQPLSERHQIAVSGAVTTTATGNHVIIEVTDTGGGIAPENLERVFDPFFTTKPAGIGTGLGLPICHSIVSRLGGTIHVRSVLGEGSTFRVSLPITAAPAGKNRISTVVPSSQPARRLRILVVDDELAVANMLSRMLSREHEVVVTTSAASALARMVEEPFDLVLCDLLMPQMSGMDLYEALLRQGTGMETRLVFMTGGAFTPRASQFLARVGNYRLEKPFVLEAVRRLVRKWSSQRR